MKKYIRPGILSMTLMSSATLAQIRPKQREKALLPGNKSKVYLFLLPFLLFTALFSFAQQEKTKTWTSSAGPLKEMALIREQIKAPVFKNKEYNIVDFGAKGDGKTMNTGAFKKAIETCNKNGGGKVIVPAGNFLTGPIYLKSNVDLHLKDTGSIITFSRDTADYPLVLTRWEGSDCMNYAPQIYAYHETNIAVTGKGLMNGNADKNNWWPWKGRKDFGWKAGVPNQFKDRDALHVMMKNKIDLRKRIFGNGHYLRPYMFQPYECKNILLSGVRMINSPMWFISPVMSENITIENLHISADGPNTDGCDPDACKNVLISNCYFNTGDDCIALKSGRDEDGRGFGRPAENHIIENCVMKNGHGGFTIGSEIAGGAKNIYAINCKMSSPDLGAILRIKTSSSRGGVIENIFLNNIEVGTYANAAIECNMFYENPGNYMPAIRNIWIENMNVAKGGKYGIAVNAYKESPVTNLKLLNCNLNGVDNPVKVDYVKGMSFENVTINGQKISVTESGKIE